MTIPSGALRVSGNNNFVAAVNLRLSAAFVFTNVGYTLEAGEPADTTGNGGGQSAWFHYTPTVNESVLITTDGSDIDTTLTVYSGTVLEDLVYVTADDDGGPGVTSELTVSMLAGTTYYIRFDGYTFVPEDPGYYQSENNYLSGTWTVGGIVTRDGPYLALRSGSGTAVSTLDESFLFSRAGQYATGSAVRTVNDMESAPDDSGQAGIWYETAFTLSMASPITVLMVAILHRPPEGRLSGLLELVSETEESLVGLRYTQGGELLVASGIDLTLHMTTSGAARPEQPVIVGITTQPDSGTFDSYLLDRRLIRVTHQAGQPMAGNATLRVGAMPRSVYGPVDGASVASLDILELDVWTSALTADEVADKVHLLDAIYGVSQS